MHALIIFIIGNYFACSTSVLAANIIGKRILHITSANKTPVNEIRILAKTFMYYINEGVFGSFNGVISYNLVNIPTPLNNSNNGSSSEYHPAIVWGQTCDTKDKLCETTMPELNIGDWLYFDNMGGYTVGVASTFNGFRISVKFHYVTESYRY